MQMLHPQSGSIQQYMEVIGDPNRGRPSSCPQCPAKAPLTAHGYYSRTIVDEASDGVIRIRRYLCRACQRTVSLLPEWALPFMRFSIPVMGEHDQSAFDREAVLEDRCTQSALSARAALGAPVSSTRRTVIAGSGGHDGGESGLQFRLKNAGHAGGDRLGAGAPVSAFGFACAFTGMGQDAGSARAANHHQRRIRQSATVPTDHLQ